MQRRRDAILCAMPPPTERRVTISEDWLTVLLGFALLAVTIVGLRPALPAFAWDGATLGALLSANNLGASLVIGLYLLVASAIGIALMGDRVRPYVAAFPAIFALAWLALALEGASFVQAWGFEYVIFSLIIGLLISNTVGVPAWLMPAVRTEYFIKVGLVLMGATILFGGIMR